MSQARETAQARKDELIASLIGERKSLDDIIDELNKATVEETSEGSMKNFILPMMKMLMHSGTTKRTSDAIKAFTNSIKELSPNFKPQDQE